MKQIQLEYQTPRPRPNLLPPPLLPRAVVWYSAVMALGLIVHICVPKMGSDPTSAKCAAARTDIETLSAGVEAFGHDEGRYPTNSESFRVLAEAPSGDFGKWAGPK